MSITSVSDRAIPSFEFPPEGIYALSKVAPRTPPTRRRFIQTAAVGGMTLGLTILGWVPGAGRASATVGTEWLNCTIFAYNGVPCTGYPYSPGNCGTDKWFKNGCFRGADNYTDCYRPIVICNSKNAWRWGSVRCADGEVKFYGSSAWVTRICNATL